MTCTIGTHSEPRVGIFNLVPLRNSSEWLEAVRADNLATLAAAVSRKGISTHSRSLRRLAQTEDLQKFALPGTNLPLRKVS